MSDTDKREAMHTPGPWVVAPFSPHYRAIAQCRTNSIRTERCNSFVTNPVTDEEARANAARIVACVNALEGLNPAGVRDVVEGAEKLINDLAAAYGEPDTCDNVDGSIIELCAALAKLRRAVEWSRGRDQ